MSFLIGGFRNICAIIDFAIYNLFSILLQTVFDIANFPLEMDIVNDFAERIYLIIAIFMTFKIVISLLGYLVNPDTINDKSQGMGNMIKRIIISLIMLIMLPTLFNKMLNLQTGVMETLPRLVLGTESGYDATNSSGTAISWSVLQAFFYYNEECGDYASSTYVNENGASQSTTPQILEFKTDKDYPQGTSPIRIFVEQVNNSCTNVSGQYTYSYTPLISTIAGAFCCYIMIGISITLAIRMFKLMILRIVAPIPIISYIDPKQAKDGTFNKWTSTLVKTWLDLFINMAILYLVIEIIKQVLTDGFGVVDYVATIGIARGSIFIVFMIIGLLLFASQAPKFICDILGIKSDNSTFGKLMAPLVGAVGGAAVGGGIGGALAGGLNGIRTATTGGKLGDAWNKGRDLGTQIRTGGEETKYKGILDRMQSNSMKNSAARELGFRNSDAVNQAYDNYKKQWLDADRDYEQALTAYNNGGSFQYDGKTFSGENLEQLIYGDGGLKSTAGKAKSRFDDFSSHIGTFGMGGKKDTSRDKAQSSIKYFNDGSSRVDTSKFVADAPRTSRPAPQPQSDEDDGTGLNIMSEAQTNNNLDEQGISYTDQYIYPNGLPSDTPNTIDTAGDYMDDIYFNQSDDE